MHQIEDKASYLSWLGLDIVLSVSLLFGVQLVIFLCPGISLVLLDTQEAPGITIHCFCRVPIIGFSKGLSANCLVSLFVY